MKFRHYLSGLLIVASATQAFAQGPLPLKYSGPPTVAAITAGDLMTRLYIFADDSMMGREVGTVYNLMGTAYIEREVRRMGLIPAGDDGFFQDIGMAGRAFDTTASTLAVDGVSFRPGTDFLAASGGKANPISGAGVVMWGSPLDTIGNPTPEQYRGKFVVVRTPVIPQGFNQAAFIKSAGFARYQAMIASDAVAGHVTVANGDFSPATIARAISGARVGMLSRDPAPTDLTVMAKVADAMLGAPFATALPGAAGKTVSARAMFIDSPRGGRNVIAKLEGSDPKLRGEFVVLGAHNDHIGFNNRPADHDSLKLFNVSFRPQGADTRNTAQLMKDSVKWAALNADLATIRSTRPARTDSIFNGADDDGSGSVALLEIAEAYAAGKVKPKRSMIFIWHTGEESGMYGSGFFARHPTVSRDSIVAQLNVDMIGRGGPDDITGQESGGAMVHGDPKYVQLVGSRRLSRELGDLIETANAGKDFGFRIDYALDANGHPQNIYCRSDHASYAAYGIPVAFFTTGGHADYHQVTDEAQYIRYDHAANLTRLIFDVSLRTANLDHRVKVDQPGPFDPNARCQQ
ncbi:MAG: M28 family peptidase [Gemmatimonadales bacterium]